ncbi:metal ABC transporter solute-binding protein, Zn/Mn family [Enterococcus sp. DIV0876]|uniref:metal ABC transporter solute-binding protein, Zn/Mn family n=1 Tax=Enterococcus sp. DIV0876 TaxID=2774633 RepID=UPI003D2FD74F
MKNFFKITLLTAAVLGLAACGQGGTDSTNQSETASTETTSDPIEVIATFYPMYDFTQHVVGDEGEVTLLMPAGTDSHDYEPSAKDMAMIQDADVFVYNNENMEMWVPSIENTLSDGDVTVVKATEGMILLPGDDDHDHDHDHDHGEEGHSHELDPHVWLAPSLAIKQVEAIRDQLSEAYPEKAAAFDENAAAYLEDLQALHESYQAAFSDPAQSHFVTQHAAFGYLALEYGLTQVPIAGLSPSEEPSASRIAELKEFVTETGIETIYFEENAKDSIARTLASEAGVELAVLNPLEGLTQEQMDNGENYISIMEQNRDALKKTTDVANDKEIAETEKEKTVYNGYFEDSAVEDRPLSDWAGDWQSVYPYLEDGTLDQVFDYKAKQSQKMSAEEYKAYYTTGYQTDVANIVITDQTMTFIFDDGTEKEATYTYAGKKILTYEAGNRGVRYLFQTDDEDAAFKYIQFSDHAITPEEAHHFHIYFGNDSQEALLEEMDHWPTYYPTNMSGLEIAQEMLAH